MRSNTLAAILAFALLSAAVPAGESGRAPARGDGVRQHRRFDASHSFRRGGERKENRRGRRRGNCHGFGFGMGMGMGMPMFLMNRLDLTAEQKPRVVDVLTDHFKAGLELRMEMADAMEAMRGVRESAAPSENDIVAASRRIGELRGRMEALRLGIKGKLEAILTPDQVKALDDLRKPRPGHGGWRNGHRGKGMMMRDPRGDGRSDDDRRMRDDDEEAM